MIRSIHHVAINTANFDAIVAFYEKAFGFVPCGEPFSWQDSAFVDSVVGVEGSAARTVMLRAGAVYLEVFEYSAPPPRDAAPLRPQDRGYTHFCVDTDDIEADFERLIAAGMHYGRALPDGMGGIRAIYGKDPDGNVIELQQLDRDHAFALERLDPIPAYRGEGRWPAILGQLRGAAAIEAAVSRPEDAALIAQADLHALMLIAQGYALNVVADADRPRFVPNFHWPHSSLGNCPDTTYFYTPLDARGTYRIWGRRNSIHMIDFQIGEAFYGTAKGGTNKALLSLDMRDMAVASDGSFAFVLSPERPPGWTGEWRAMPPSAETITVRQVAYDWLGEREAELHIERLDPPAPRPMRADEVQARIDAIATYARLMAEFPFGARLSAGVRTRGLVNGGVDLITFGEAGGLADQYYYVGAFDLAPDEALIVEVEVPMPCRYWNIQLSDEMNAALDYIYHQSSLNGQQAVLDTDGRFRAVIAHRDPGVANWLDTGGVRSGLFMGRWKEAAAKPAPPTVRKVAFDAIGAELPAGTARIDAARRANMIAARRDAMLRRLGY